MTAGIVRDQHSTGNERLFFYQVGGGTAASYFAVDGLDLLRSRVARLQRRVPYKKQEIGGSRLDFFF